jgi:hypothetical protein
MRLLKVLGLIVAGLVGLFALLMVLSILAVSRVQSQTRETQASFRVGQSLFDFRIPDGALDVSINFFSTGGPRADCGMAVLRHRHGDKLLLIGETIDRKELPDRTQLAAVLRAQRWPIERCSQMNVTFSNFPLSWPYRGTVKVHYDKGVVTKVEKPFFWD